MHTTLDLDLQNATLDAINKHMDALEARKDFKKHLASLQAKREKRGILKNKLTTKAEYEASLAAWKALPAEQNSTLIQPFSPGVRPAPCSNLLFTPRFSSRAILRIPAFRMTGLPTGKYAEPPTGPPAIRTERTGA